MVSWLIELPWSYVFVGCLTLGLAPFVPQPHLTEKLQMLRAGELRKPIDWFDLVMHASPFLLGVAKALAVLIAG